MKLTNMTNRLHGAHHFINYPIKLNFRLVVTNAPHLHDQTHPSQDAQHRSQGHRVEASLARDRCQSPSAPVEAPTQHAQHRSRLMTDAPVNDAAPIFDPTLDPHPSPYWITTDDPTRCYNPNASHVPNAYVHQKLTVPFSLLFIQKYFNLNLTKHMNHIFFSKCTLINL